MSESAPVSRMDQIIADSAEAARRVLDGSCTATECPYHPQAGGWAMGPDGWAQMKERHDKYHV